MRWLIFHRNHDSLIRWGLVHKFIRIVVVGGNLYDISVVYVYDWRFFFAMPMCLLRFMCLYARLTVIYDCCSMLYVYVSAHVCCMSLCMFLYISLYLPMHLCLNSSVYHCFSLPLSRSRSIWYWYVCALYVYVCACSHTHICQCVFLCRRTCFRSL